MIRNVLVAGPGLSTLAVAMLALAVDTPLRRGKMTEYILDVLDPVCQAKMPHDFRPQCRLNNRDQSARAYHASFSTASNFE